MEAHEIRIHIAINLEGGCWPKNCPAIYSSPEVSDNHFDGLSMGLFRVG